MEIIAAVELGLGPIDIWFTNAGTGGRAEFLAIEDKHWMRCGNCM